MKGDVTNFVKEMKAFLRQVREIEYWAGVIKSTRSIDAALQYGIDRRWSFDKNFLLDDIGDIVGMPRYNKSNFDYSVMLKAKIQMNASRGEPERIISAIRAICQTEVIRYYEYYPASVVVEFESDVVPDGINQIMEKVVSGGVHINVVQMASDAFAFSADGSDELGDTAHGFAPVDQSSGGRLSQVVK
jgi:hypothetical protein